jgi:hypothetical protein
MENLNHCGNEIYSPRWAKIEDLCKLSELMFLLREHGFTGIPQDCVAYSSLNDKMNVKANFFAAQDRPVLVSFEPTDGRWDNLGSRLDNMYITQILCPLAQGNAHPLVDKYIKIQ